jgi:Ca2+-binding RTX toxin-like protein
MIKPQLVNTVIIGNQFEQSITTLASGDYIVTWASDQSSNGLLGIYSQRLDKSGRPTGPETLVQAPGYYNLQHPDVEALSNGGYVISWVQHGFSAFIREYDAAGLPIRDAAPLSIGNPRTTHSLAHFSDGSYIVASTSDWGWYQGDGIYLSHFEADGTPRTAEVRITPDVAFMYHHPSVTSTSSDGYVVTWSEGVSSYRLMMRLFDKNGNSLGLSTQVSDPDTRIALQSSVTVLENGNFVVAWADGGPDWNGVDIKSRLYHASGSALGGAEIVNTNIAGPQQNPEVVSLVGGGYVVTWATGGENSSPTSIAFRIFGADGSPIGGENIINTDWDQDFDSQISSTIDGGFIVTWTSQTGDIPGSASDVYIQKYDANGVAIGANVNPITNAVDGSLYTQMAQLANHAYINIPGQGDGFRSAFLEDQVLKRSALIFDDPVLAPINGWEAVSAAELGIAESKASGRLTYSIKDGRYIAIEKLVSADPVEGDATIYKGVYDGKKTVAIAFSGTDQNADWDTYLDFQRYYDLFAPVIKGLQQFIQKAGIEQVLLTGHSLGSSAALKLMHDNSISLPNAQLFAFGSPGIEIEGRGIADGPSVSITHTNDLVAAIGSNFGVAAQDLAQMLLVAAPGAGIVKLAAKLLADAYKTKSQVGSKINVLIPDNSNWLYNIEEHSMDSKYIPSVEKLVTFAGDKTLASAVFSLPIFAAVRANEIYKGKTVYLQLGSKEGETLHEKGGNQIILGGDGEDEIHLLGYKGLIIDGGGGADRVIVGFNSKNVEIPDTVPHVQIRQNNAVVADIYNTEMLVFTDKIVSVVNAPLNLQVVNKSIASLQVANGVTGAQAGSTVKSVVGTLVGDIIYKEYGEGGVVWGMGGSDFISTDFRFEVVSNLKIDTSAASATPSITIDGGEGADVMIGGNGNETFIVDHLEDEVKDFGGFDVVKSSVSFNLPSGIEKLVLTGNAEIGGGNSGGNKLYGTAKSNFLVGGGGADLLLAGSSVDVLLGGTGADTLIGGKGRDFMTGDAGADDFDFNSIKESGKTAVTRDKITDFKHLVDDIDLRTIDANTTRSGNQAFKWIGTSGFDDVAGQLRYKKFNSAVNANDKTIISGDVNGDGKTDFQIELSGLITLTKGDFIL